MDKTILIPFTLRGIKNDITVCYKANTSVIESGFDALNLPFDPQMCIGYPTLHAYIDNFKNTGYKRYCGWVQLIKREYYSSTSLEAPDEDTILVDSEGDIFFAHGYPAELYDAPCFNLGNNVKGKWTAYTYLVDMPSRMNDHKLIFLAGFKWGCEEAMVDDKLFVSMLPLEEIDNKMWGTHIKTLKEMSPQYNYQY